MSNYQFVVFSGKNKNKSTIKQEDVESETEELSINQREVDSSSSSSLSRTSSSSSSTSSRKQLIVLTTSSDGISNSATIESDSRKRRINNTDKQSSFSRKRDSSVSVSGKILKVDIGQKQVSVDAGASQLGGKYSNSNAPGKAKIPRPANAFMLFANEWRRKLANENPRESNKDISVRLGVLWKNMEKDAKEKYFSLARQVDAEHKRKYPDYVYNPKEARLRKAMREQCRELSRQSILQSTVTTTSGNASATGANSTNGSVGERGVAGVGAGSGGGGGGGGGNRSGSAGVEISGSGNFLSHPMSSGASPAPAAAVSVSSLPSSSSGYNSGRIINPWFPVGHTGPASHIKPMLSHRVMQAHQRTFDKTKEVLRKQPECAGAFSAASAAAASCYPGDFTVHGAPTQAASDTSVGGLESNDYCSGGGIGEFSDAQKWHPYQSTAAYHARGPINKMTSRHAMQSINTHGHGPWNQFCGVPLFSMAAQNQMVRGPRHMVFLQDQQERHCGYPDEMPMNYMTNKIDSHRLQPSYTQNYQQETEKCIEDGPRWEPPSAEPALTNLVSSPREQERERVREKHPPKKEEPNNKEYQENVEPQTKTPRKQPLPGFHQAFGSTEIGRFSRSEFFASMVGDNNVSSSGSVTSSTSSSAIGVGVVGSNSNGVSKNRNSSIDTSSDINSQSSRVDSVDLESLSNPSDDAVTSDDVDNTSPDNFNSLSSLSTMTSHFDSVRTTMPRWHSPYINAIGSQI